MRDGQAGESWGRAETQRVAIRFAVTRWHILDKSPRLVFTLIA